MDLPEFLDTAVVAGFIVSFVCAVAIVVTTRWHGKLTLDSTAGVQKIHTAPTPRVGGVAIFIGLLASCVASDSASHALFVPLLLAGVPAFLFGFAEDLTKRVSVRARLLATMASGGVAWALMHVSIRATGIPAADFLLSFLPVSVLFTAFAVGGVANSINIIDGFNGLAGGIVTLCLAALGMIALDCGDHAIASTCFSVAAVTLGFFCVNFPLGKLFLGDGGAYLLGYLLAWLGVLLQARNPQVTPWAPLLACAYPIFETLFTIARRLWARSHPGQPDSQHLHSLIKIAVTARLFRNWRADLRNASVSPFSWAIAALPAGFSVKYAGAPAALMVSFAISFGVYLSVYRYLAAAAKALVPAAQSGPAITNAEEEASALT